MTTRRLVTLCALLMTAANSAAQDQVYVLSHPVLDADFGSAVKDLGDLDGDGATEVAVGQPGTSFGNPAAGVSVLRGGAGTELFFFGAPANVNYYGFSLGVVSDLDGDGTRDVIIGAPGSPSIPNDTTYVEVRSGATGNVLRALFGATGSGYGNSVAGCEDVDGDGTPDFVIGAPLSTTVAFESGSVFMISGLTGNTLYRIDGSLASEHLGHSVVTIGDQDGDGLRDLLIGAPGNNYAALYSSANGALLRTFVGPATTRAFGFAVDALDDLDGDGLEDVIIGSPEEPGNTGVDSGAARVYSSASGAQLYQFLGGFGGDFLGYSVADVGDLDFDGVRDFGYGAPLLTSMSFFPAGFIAVHSGATGAQLFLKGGPSTAAAYGYSLDGVADFDQDGLPEALGGAPGRGEAIAVRYGQSPGAAYCFGGPTANCPCGNFNDGTQFSGMAGCANSSHSGGAGLISLGDGSAAQDTTVLRVRGATPGQPGLFFQGDNAVNGGAGIIFGDGLRCAGGNVVRLEVLTADAQGGGTSSVFLAADGGVSAGDLKHYQFWYRDPAGSPCGSSFNLSNGIELSWLP